MKKTKKLGSYGFGGMLGTILGASIPGAQPFIPILSMLGETVEGELGKKKKGNQVDSTNHIGNEINPYGLTRLKFGGTPGKYVEVEDGEVSLREDGSIRKFKGKTHAEGGIEYNPYPGDEFVYSNRVGYTKDGKITSDPSNTHTSFAKFLKKFDRPYSEIDPIAISTRAIAREQNQKIADEKNPGETQKFALGDKLPEIQAIADRDLSLGVVDPVAPNQAITPITPTQSQQKGLTSLFGDLSPKQSMLPLLSRVPGLAYNASQAFQKPEQEKLQLNQREDDAESLINQQRVDLRSLMSRIGKGEQAAISGLRERNLNPNQYTANAANIAANAAGQKANISLREQSARNQLLGSKASFITRLGERNRQERLRRQTTQSRNDAVTTNNRSRFFQDLSRFGDDITKKEITEKMLAQDLGNRRQDYLFRAGMLGMMNQRLGGMDSVLKLLLG